MEPTSLNQSVKCKLILNKLRYREIKKVTGNHKLTNRQRYKQKQNNKVIISATVLTGMGLSTRTAFIHQNSLLYNRYCHIMYEGDLD